MAGSLLVSGLLFILLQFPASFWGICAGIFFVILVADGFRPAVFVAINTYSKPESRARSVTLLRLAINLGFSGGPAVGELIIANSGYSGLFWVDGITCITAGFLLLKLIHPKKAIENVKEITLQPKVMIKNKPYLLFIVAWVCSDLFSFSITRPCLYYAKVHMLSKAKIGLLMGWNVFLIFLFEMPLIKYLESRARPAVFHLIS